MLLGHWIEMRSVMGASKALEELIKLMPKEAHKIDSSGNIVDVGVEELHPGDMILVKSGEKIPLDGEIFEGESTVDESMLTGESVPVEKRTGMEAIGGSINGDGVLKIRVNKTGNDTYLAQVIQLVSDAESTKSKAQGFADIAAKWLFYVAVVAGIITLIYWATTGDFEFALERMVTVLIIACPHALGLAMPLVNSRSTSIAAKKGLLIRNRIPFESAWKLNRVVFDKTGTLTEGNFGVTDIHPTKNVNDDELMRLAYSVETQSDHPIAKGIVKEGKKRKLELYDVTNYKNLTGKGLTAEVNGSEIAASLNKIGVHYKISYSVSLALRYIPDIQRDFRAIAQSQQARGIDLSSKEKLSKRIKNATSIVLPLILSSLDRIEVISNAMELRGFGKSKRRTWYSAKSFKRFDYITIAVVL